MKLTVGLMLCVLACAAACGSPAEATAADKDFLERRETALREFGEAIVKMRALANAPETTVDEIGPAAIAFTLEVRRLRDVMFTGPESKKFDLCRNRTWDHFDTSKDLTDPLFELTKMAKREKSGKPLRTGEDPIPNEAQRHQMAVDIWHDVDHRIGNSLCQQFGDVSTMCKRVADKLKAGVNIDLLTRTSCR